MTIEEATSLITVPAIDADKGPQRWADLGSGAGLFSRALLGLLPAESIVYAVDSHLQTISDPRIEFIQADFEKEPLSFPPLNGIIMANSLHYVKDKLSLLLQLREYLQAAGVIIIVEYEKQRPNPWIPYPLKFSLAEQLFRAAGFTALQQISERPSIYNRTVMYSAWCRSTEYPR